VTECLLPDIITFGEGRTPTLDGLIRSKCDIQLIVYGTPMNTRIAAPLITEIRTQSVPTLPESHATTVMASAPAKPIKSARAKPNSGGLMLSTPMARPTSTTETVADKLRMRSAGLEIGFPLHTLARGPICARIPHSRRIITDRFDNGPKYLGTTAARVQ